MFKALGLGSVLVSCICSVLGCVRGSGTHNMVGGVHAAVYGGGVRKLTLFCFEIYFLRGTAMKSLM